LLTRCSGFGVVRRRAIPDIGVHAKVGGTRPQPSLHRASRVSVTFVPAARLVSSAMLRYPTQDPDVLQWERPSREARPRVVTSPAPASLSKYKHLCISTCRIKLTPSWSACLLARQVKLLYLLVCQPPAQRPGILLCLLSVLDARDGHRPLAYQPVESHL
jgi:hypothetical protein